MIRRRDLMAPLAMAIATGLGLAAFTQRQRPAGKVQCADKEICDERAAQMNLPHAGDPLWAKLAACKVGYNRKSDTYSLTPTADVLALVGKRIRVSGFVLPLDGTDKTSHFLIGVNTPVCFYHPPGDPNQVIEVSTIHPTDWTDKPTPVEGVFQTMNNGQLGVFFRLVNARQVA